MNFCSKLVYSVNSVVFRKPFFFSLFTPTYVTNLFPTVTQPLFAYKILQPFSQILKMRETLVKGFFFLFDKGFDSFFSPFEYLNESPLSRSSFKTSNY